MPTKGLRPAVRTRRPKVRPIAAGILLLLWVPALALGSEPVDTAEGQALSLALGVEFGLSGFATSGANFGAGRVDVRDGDTSSDADWAEAFVKPSLDVDYPLGGYGSVYAGLSAVAALTLGDGDVGGYTRGGDGEADIEAAFLGWRSGEWLAPTLGEDAVDLSYGRQEFQVGDGFLIWDGNLDQLDKGAYWTAPRRAFRQAGLIRLNTEPVRADLFYLESDGDQDDTELAGLSLEYLAEGLGTFGLMYFRVIDSGPPDNFGPRDGMDVLSVRVNGLSLPALPGLSLWGEHVSEQGGGRDGAFDASAWYLEAEHRFDALPWAPRLSYRYSRFSGDPNPDDEVRRDFEPFFYGWGRGWGTWIQGEVVGEYLLFNSNQVSHMLHLAASPSKSIELGALGYRFYLDEKYYYGSPVRDRHFADELNLYLDWTVNERLTASAAYGIAFPGEAAKEVLGGDRFQLVEVSLSLSF